MLVSGYTDSRDFPVTDGSTYNGGRSDIALTLLDLDDASETFGQCLYSTYYGGRGADTFKSLNPTSDGRIVAAGYTESGRLGTDGAVQPSTGGGRDMLLTSFELRVPRTAFLRGDCSGDGDISDAVCILNWLFAGGATLGCVAATNTNGDDAADISDATYLLNHLFLGKAAPVAPFPTCGAGGLEADVALGCQAGCL